MPVKPAKYIACVFASIFCAVAAHGAGGGMIVLQTGSDWCESGEYVRKTFESPAFRRAVHRSGFDFAVYDDMEYPSPKVSTANEALKGWFVRSCRFPAISFLSPSPRRFFALLENIPYDVSPEELAGQVNAALAARKEAEALFRTGARLRGPNPHGAADAYGRGFEILSEQIGELEEHRLREGEFAYGKEWKELVRLDAGDKYGWRMRFEAGYGFDLVEKATKLRDTGLSDKQRDFIASLRRIPTNRLTVVQRQSIEMAEYAIVRGGDETEKKKSLLKAAFELGRDTVWGQCAMGYLILSGVDIEKRPPYRAKVRPRPAQKPKERSISANSLKARLAQISPFDKLTEAQKSDIALYAVLRRVGLSNLNDLAMRPGAWVFLAEFLKDRAWMENFAWSGQCPERALFALESLVYQDGGRWIDGDGPGRRFATAVALEYPDCDEEWLADYLDAYRETAKAKRLHIHALGQPVWQWRYAVAPRGSEAVDDPPNQQRFMDKFCNMNVARNGGAHHFVPYRMYNCFGEFIHTAEYYEPWITAGEWPKRKYTYIVGGVCGELSTFGSICSSAHGLPAIPCGQPGHCAYTRRLLDGDWRVDNYIAPPTTMRRFWPDGGSWTYIQADEGTFEGNRERRRNADRFSELAAFAARGGRDAEDVAAFHKRACRAWPTHYGAWRAYSDWLASARRPVSELHEFALAATSALKGWRQPLWDLLTPYFERVAEVSGAAGLSAAVIELAPSLRQGEGKIQEEGDFRAAMAKWTEPIAKDEKRMEEVAMAVLSAQAGTRDYFAQALAWCGDGFVEDEKRLAKLLALAGKTANATGGRGRGGPARSFLAPLILSAAASGNISVFRRLSAMQDKLSRYKPLGKRLPAHDFGAELVSSEGLLRTSSSSVADTPELHAHALYATPCTRNVFQTDKETAPWAMVLLPKPAVVKGVVVIDAGKDEKARAMEVPIEVELSEDGQNWQKVFASDKARDTYSVNLEKNKNRYLCVRVRRTPDAQDEPFRLAKILVYGRK